MAKQPVQEPRRAARPRDAATLVLYKMRRGKPCILMGMRHSRHKFMPDQYVFPGGRVDRSDGYVAAASELKKHVSERLAKAASPHRARALAIAAIRETWEETGIILGDKIKAPPARMGNGWEDFYASGRAPALGKLEFISRAVTPPYRPIRFNARFFLANGEDTVGKLGGSGELLNLDWVTLSKAKDLPIPRIQQIVLDQLDDLIDAEGRIKRPRRVPLRRMLYGQQLQDYE